MFKRCWMNTGELRTPKVYTHHARFPLYYSHTIHTILNVQVGKKKWFFTKSKSSRIPLLEPCDSSGLQEELSPHFSAPYLFLTGSGRHGGGKNDAHVSLCQCPSFLVPSFCWTQPILFLLYYFWPVNMERRSNYGPFRGEYQSPFPTVLLIEWWVGPG